MNPTLRTLNFNILVHNIHNKVCSELGVDPSNSKCKLIIYHKEVLGVRSAEIITRGVKGSHRAIRTYRGLLESIGKTHEVMLRNDLENTPIEIVAKEGYLIGDTTLKKVHVTPPKGEDLLSLDELGKVINLVFYETCMMVEEGDCIQNSYLEVREESPYSVEMDIWGREEILETMVTELRKSLGPNYEVVFLGKKEGSNRETFLVSPSSDTKDLDERPNEDSSGAGTTRDIESELRTLVLETLVAEYKPVVKATKEGLTLEIKTSTPYLERIPLLSSLSEIEIEGYKSFVFNGSNFIRIDLVPSDVLTIEEELVTNTLENTLQEFLDGSEIDRLTIEGVMTELFSISLVLTAPLGVERFDKILTRLGEMFGDNYKVMGYPKEEKLFLTIEVVK